MRSSPCRWPAAVLGHGHRPDAFTLPDLGGRPGHGLPGRDKRASLRIATGLGLAIALCLGALAPASVQAQARRDPLPPAVQQALADAQVPEEALVGLLMPLHGPLQGQRRWERDADRPVQPGSTMKLVTSAVALDVLGPNLRGHTELLRTGTLDGDVLRGDVVLKGGADADLDVPALLGLLLELRDQGVREIDGQVLLDRSLFTPTRLDLGLPPFDDAPEWPYNVIPDALHLGGSLLGLTLSADAQSVRVQTVPQLQGLEIRSAMVLTDGRCATWSNGWQPALVQDDGQRVWIELRGTFPRHCSARTWLQLIDRDRLADLLIRTLWARLGGTLKGPVREGLTPADAQRVARHQARPWGELLRPLNKQSDNTLTRLLYLQMGAGGGQRRLPNGRPADTAPSAAAPAVAAGASSPGASASNAAGRDTSPGDATPALSTAERAEREIKRWMTERGIPLQGFVVDNGSGLSRAERLTARQLAAILRQALTGPHAADLLMSLPTVGVDGTMRNRLKDTPAHGFARLKTGTLRNVVALAGQMPDAQGRPWIFVAVINHDNAGRARPALDALVRSLAEGELPLGADAGARSRAKPASVPR